MRPEGPIFFAGEHLSYVVFWQEGAALSAHAAMRVLASRRRSGGRRLEAASPFGVIPAKAGTYEH